MHEIRDDQVSFAQRDKGENQIGAVHGCAGEELQDGQNRQDDKYNQASALEASFFCGYFVHDEYHCLSVELCTQVFCTGRLVFVCGD
jgi:hypothetical protein